MSTPPPTQEQRDMMFAADLLSYVGLLLVLVGVGILTWRLFRPTPRLSKPSSTRNMEGGTRLLVT